MRIARSALCLLLLAVSVVGVISTVVGSAQVGGVLPNKITHVEPTYPPAALAQRVEGFVMIAITVGTDGRVTDAKILQSIPLLDQAALAAVRQWQYDPRSMTRPVVARVMVPFRLPAQSGSTAERPRPAATGDRPQPSATRVPPTPATSPAPPSVREGGRVLPGPLAAAPERPDQKLDRLTAAINSGSLQGDALAQALRERALLNATTGRLGFAHPDIDRLLAMDPRDPDAHFARGLAFFTGNRPEAIRSFSQVIQLQPKRVDGHRGRAWTNLVAGEYAAAARDFDQVLQIEPNDTEAYRGRGWASFHARNYDRAILDFTELMRRSPGNPEASAARGLCYYLVGRLPEARADFRSTIRYGRPRPSSALTYNTLTLDDHLVDRRVFSVLDERTQRNPNDIEGWLASGVFRYAEPSFDQALKIKPDDVDALMLRAIFHATPVQGTTAVRGYNRAPALADLTEVIRLKPDDGEAYFWRALVRAMDKEALPSAVADGEKALALTPGDPALRALVEKLKIEQRSWEQSKQQAAIARAQFEKDSPVYAAAFLVVIAAMFTPSTEPPDPFKRSYLDDMRMRNRYRPCIDSVGRLVSRSACL